MNAIDIFAQPVWRHLVFALLHTLWQGTLLTIVLAVALRRLPARFHQTRYVLALSAQFGLLLAGLTTWAALEYQPPITKGLADVPAVQTTQARALGFASTPISVVLPPISNRPRSITSGPSPVWIEMVALGWLIGVGSC